MADLTETDLARIERAAKLALIAVVLGAIILAIDHRLKKFIIEQGQVAIGLLNQATKLAEEARDGRVAAAGKSPAGDGGAVSGADRVVQPAGAGAAVDGAADGGKPPPVRKPSGAGRGVRGNGSGTGGEA